MRINSFVVACVAMSMLGCAPVFAQAKEEAPKAVQADAKAEKPKKEAKAEKPKKEPKICKMLATSGTRFGNGRECKTAAQWEKAKGQTLTGASVREQGAEETKN